jgi:hypothetical protein
LLTQRRAKDNRLDPIEKAIRNAFEKGNADDRAFREKVYRSAFAALDRALQANPNVTVENAIKRRKAMQAKIAEIESEFLPAVAVPGAEGEPTGTAAPSVDSPASLGAAPSGPAVAPPVSSSGQRVEPSLDGPASGNPSAAAPVTPEPTLDRRADREGTSSPPGAAEVAPDRDERRARRRRFPLAGALVGLVVLAALGAGLWWLVQMGIIKTGRSPGQPPSSAQEAAAVPPAGSTEPLKPGQADDGRDWIIVFSPSDPTLARAPSDAKVEAMKDDTGAFLRMRSGASGAAVSFDVGQGILDQLAGKHAVFDIVARAEEGKDTQMSVDCDFGALGDCGRKRYAVGHVRNEYLFEVDFPDKSPGAAGSIAINSDFDKQGKSVDIYEIRVTAGD